MRVVVVVKTKPTPFTRKCSGRFVVDVVALVPRLSVGWPILRQDREPRVLLRGQLVLLSDVLIGVLMFRDADPESSKAVCMVIATLRKAVVAPSLTRSSVA